VTDRPRSVRVLVVEGQPLLRDLLARLIDQQSGMRAVALCDSARTAIEATERAIDVALIGPHVPGGGGVPLGEALRARSSRLGIVVLAAPERAIVCVMGRRRTLPAGPCSPRTSR
jgi:DNA-binding NarL/FixJ family response regulator